MQTGCVKTNDVRAYHRTESQLTELTTRKYTESIFSIKSMLCKSNKCVQK